MSTEFLRRVTVAGRGAAETVGAKHQRCLLTQPLAAVRGGKV